MPSMSKLLVVASLWLSAGANALDDKKETRLRTYQHAVKASNLIGFKMIYKATELNPDKNYFFSPLSAHLALSMAYNGSSGNSTDIFENFFGLSELKDPPEEKLASLNSANLALVRALEKNGDGVTLKIANSAYTNTHAAENVPYEFQDSYVRLLKKSYNVQTVTPLNFKADQAAEVMNLWASEATDGLVPQIVTPDEVNSLAWALFNASYLQGKWATSFNRSSGFKFNKKEVPSMVSRPSQLLYARKEGAFEAVSLPLMGSEGEPDSIHVLVVKPAPRYFQSTFWESNIEEDIINKLKGKTGKIEMPIFTISDEMVLKKGNELTRELVLSDLFEQRTAEFDRMDKEEGLKTMLGIIKQAAKIEWNESGIRAAAATVVGGATRGAPPRNLDFDMKVDSSFYFIVYDTVTKAYLFLGSVQNL